MKKKRLFTALAVFIVLGAGGLAWWRMPVKFLRNISAEEVAGIEIFDGNTGRGLTVTDEGDIAYIVTDIQGKSMQKEKVSIGYMGTRFRLCFLDAGGRKVEELVVNHYGTIRKDPFFYRDETESLCVDYLEGLLDSGSIP